MDNTLDYVVDLPLEIKLIIYAKIPGNLMVSEFNDRYPRTYRRFKNIIRMNRSLSFRDYITEGSYFWAILLKSELAYDQQKSLGYYVFYYDHNWEPLTAYMNIISVSMHCLSLFYDRFTGVYGYANGFSDIEICLLYDSITDLHNKEVYDIFKYGNIQEIHLKESNLFGMGINSFIFVNFLLMIVPRDLIIFEKIYELEWVMNIASESLPRDNDDDDRHQINLYKRYGSIYDKHYSNLMLVLNID
jgi:hypothetical protein